MKKNASIIIEEINKSKIIFKTNYAWAICLDADWDGKSFFFLKNDSLNQKKIQNILPNAVFKSEGEPKKETKTLFLRRYQEEDVNFLAKLTNAAIFSEMRTGKTPVALFTWEKWKIKKLLIITPSSLQNHWQKTIYDWIKKPSYIITYLKESERSWFYQKILQRKTEEWIVIISKDKFRTDKDNFQKLKKKSFLKQDYCVIIDEAHFLRNFQSQQSKAMKVLQDAAHKLVLTGTPVVNNYSDVFGLLNFLQPDGYPSYHSFINKYFTISRLNFQKGGKRLFLKKIKGFKSNFYKNDLHKKINTLSVNRRQKDVLPWLPNIIYHQEYLMMENEQRKLYLEISRERFEKQAIEVLTKLKTVTLCPKILRGEKNGCKINYLIEYLEEYSDRTVIIFSTRTSTFLTPLAELLKEKKIKFGQITGQTDITDKQKTINDFQRRIINILLCNIKSACLGLNLSQADTAIFADRSYTPADNEQAEARFLPTDNKKEDTRPRLVIELICKNSIDEKINKLLKNKENIMKFINSHPEKFFD